MKVLSGTHYFIKLNIYYINTSNNLMQIMPILNEHQIIGEKFHIIQQQYNAKH